MRENEDQPSPEHQLAESFNPRVLVINSARKWIGEAAHCISLVRGLQNRGIHVILVCRKGYALEAFAKKQGIPHDTLRMKGNFTGVHDLLDLLKLRRIIKRHQINVIHCHRGKDHWLSASVRFLLAPWKRKPVVIRTRHVVVPVKTHFFNRWLYKHGTNAVIAVSRAAAASYEDLVLRSIPIIIYAPVDSERFNPGKRSEERRRRLGIPSDDTTAPLIGLVGRFQRIKGQQLLIRAAEIILKSIPNARFVLAGKGSEERKQALLRLAVKHKVESYFHFTGYQEDIEFLIASLDVGVAPSLGSEGSSRIVMEYMASGVPIVASAVGGIPEILEDGKYGRLVEPGDPNELADAVTEVLKHPEKSKKSASAALEKARQFHHIDRFLDETLNVYRNSLEKV